MPLTLYSWLSAHLYGLGGGEVAQIIQKYGITQSNIEIFIIVCNWDLQHCFQYNKSNPKYTYYKWELRQYLKQTKNITEFL